MLNDKGNTELKAYCGLYCAECYKYKKGKCPGCKMNTKASWCKVRTCCINKDIASCADCPEQGRESCKYFNNFMAKFFGFVFNSDRGKAIELIKSKGYKDFADYMATNKLQTIKRK